MSDGVEVAAPWEEDKLGRQGVAKFLTNYLDKNEDIKVLNINAPWGTGKTFFLTNWRNELNQTRVCLYFNAWENDFCGDPFIALSAVLYEGLKKECPGVAVSEFKDAAKKAIVAATPALMKGVVKSFSGVDIDEISDALGDAAEKAVEKLIQDNNETLSKIKNFKTSLKKLSEEAAMHKAANNDLHRSPVYIFIDELDRCRPTYAIELLEKLKHFFDVEGCRFVVATDTDQMIASVKSVYGEGFDSFRYLRRFFDSEFKLENKDIVSWIIAMCAFRHETHHALPIFPNLHAARKESIYRNSEIIEPPEGVLVVKGELRFDQLVMLALANTFKLKLRELDKVIRHLKMMEANVSTQFEFFWAAYLVCLKLEAPDFYSRLIGGQDSLAMGELKKRYAGQILYTGNASINLHDLAVYYINFFVSGARVAPDIIGRSRDNQLLREVSRFLDTRENVAAYVDLVDLARSE